MEPIPKIREAFTINRAEELGLDVWDDFLIPLFYNELDLLHAKKSRRIVGGRGSGKTMLLRYLSHQSQFSKNRNENDGFNVKSIGLYWRADTNFLTMLNKQGVSEERWIRLFKHYLVLNTSIEILLSIASIANSNCKEISNDEISKLNFDGLSSFDAEAKGTYFNLENFLKRKLIECETAAHNPRDIDDVRALPDSFVTNGLIKAISSQIPSLKNSSFCLFIDEYENLLEYQQKTINTLIKHSQSPLIFHIAMKVNGMSVFKTLGEESIQDIADYRTINLDDLLANNDFETFAAEIFLHRLSAVGATSIDVDLLKDPEKIQDRTLPDYRKELISSVQKTLPSLSYSEMAKSVIENLAQRKKLEKEIDRELERRSCDKKYTSSDFIIDNFEQAAIIIPTLLSRDSNTPDLVYDELQKLINSEENRFTGSSNWISNNFIGSYLKIFRSYDRPCPFYAGFQTFVALSRGNIRHFIELCNAAIVRSKIQQDDLYVDIQTQSIATRAASEDILNESPTYGRLGSRLRAFIYNLGHIFEYSHMRKTQSESEINHFSIRGGYSVLSDNDTNFLSEAEKWGVLYKQKSTKDKSDSNPDSVEWILNPIYAPFFFISYRKKRKLELSSDQFRILHSGSQEERANLEKSFRMKWDLEDSEKPYSYTLL